MMANPNCGAKPEVSLLEFSTAVRAASTDRLLDVAHELGIYIPATYFLHSVNRDRIMQELVDGAWRNNKLWEVFNLLTAKQ